jgi:hypothetical protein
MPLTPGHHEHYRPGEPDRPVTSIVRLDLETRTERAVFRIEHYGGFALHPGGRGISVVAGLNRWEIWTLDNLPG